MATQNTATSRPRPRPTGPSTPEAKDRVRRNALKHGLRAETLIADEDQSAVDRKIADWCAILGPVDDVEQTLVERAAIAAVRLKRCVRAEEASLEESAQNALRVWEENARHQVRGKGQNLETRPAETVEALEQSGFGIDWLVRKWQFARKQLEFNSLDLDVLHLIVRLFKFDPVLGYDRLAENPRAAEIWRAGLLVIGPTSLQFLPMYTPFIDPIAEGQRDNPTEALNRLGGKPAQPPARANLFRWIDAEIERLEALRPAAWDAAEAPRREEVLQGALVPIDDEDQRRQRYERMSESSLHRSLFGLARRRKICQHEQALLPSEPAVWSEAALDAPALAPAPAPNNDDSTLEPTPPDLPKAQQESKLHDSKAAAEADQPKRREAAPEAQQERPEGAPSLGIWAETPSASPPAEPAGPRWANNAPPWENNDPETSP